MQLLQVTGDTCRRCEAAIDHFLIQLLPSDTPERSLSVLAVPWCEACSPAVVHDEAYERPQPKKAPLPKRTWLEALMARWLFAEVARSSDGTRV